MQNAALSNRCALAASPEKKIASADQLFPVNCRRHRTVTKILLVMRLTILCMIVGLLNVHAKGVSQSISLTGKDVPLKKVFTAIEKQTGYVVFYNKGLLGNARAVSVSVSDMPLTDFLEVILRDQPLSYQINSKTIVIKEKQGTGILPSDPDDAGRLTTPPQTITGTILSVDGAPLQGASVKVKGISGGTSSDEKGMFSIQAEPGAVLIISFVGYETVEHKVKGRDPVIIRLQVANTALKDVVVTGIFERKSKTYTGAANTITANDIKRAGNQNILGILSMLDPGVQMPQDLLNGSDPNKIANLRLRGASSLPATLNVSELSTSKLRDNKDFYSAYGKQVDDIKNTYSSNPNLPLFILDGFEVSISRINDLDINLIQSVTILKDASATAIYGSRGANGVIVFERMKPKAGKFRVGYKADLTLNLPDLHDYKLLNAAEKLEVEKLAGVYNTGYSDMDQDLKVAYNERYKEVLRGRDTYWPALPVRNTLAQRHGITLDGGNDNVTYGMDFTYNNNNGVMKGSDRTSYNGGIYIGYRTQKLLLNNQLSLQYTNGTNSPWGSFSQYVRMNPYYSPYDANGNITPYLQRSIASLQTAAYGDIYNPVYDAALNSKNFRKTRNLINNTSITYNFTPDLSLRGRFSVTSQNDDNEVFLPAEHTIFRRLKTDVFQRGSYTAGYGKLFAYDANLDLNYNLRFGDHQIYSTLSSRANQNSTENVVVEVNGLPSPITDYIFYGRKYVNDRPTGSESTIRTMGFLGNINYSYDSRYFADFSYRLDGSSSLGSDKSFAPFWSIGAGWNLHHEKALAPLVDKGIISQLKVRGSTGLTGAQQFDPYMAFRTYNYFLNEVYINTIGASLLNIGNQNLTWQGTRKNNIGTDIVMLNDRLTVNADYYYDVTDKFIADFSLPLSTGFTTYKGNLGSINSKGWEVRASLQLIRSKDFKKFGLMLHANVGSNKSTVKKISDELKAQNSKMQSLTSTESPFTRYEEGASMDAIWLVPSLGIDPATGRELFLKKDGTTTFVWDARDMISAGVALPKVRGSFGVNMNYQGFQLTTFFSYRMGGQQFNKTLLDRIENVNLVDNADRRVLTQRWKEKGDVAYFKAINISGSSTNASTRFLQNDNSLEMSSLSLLYRFDQAKIKWTRMQNLSVGFYMNNLFRVATIAQERGTDYPFARSFSLSIQTGF